MRACVCLCARACERVSVSIPEVHFYTHLYGGDVYLRLNACILHARTHTHTHTHLRFADYNTHHIAGIQYTNPPIHNNQFTRSTAIQSVRSGCIARYAFIHTPELAPTNLRASLTCVYSAFVGSPTQRPPSSPPRSLWEPTWRGRCISTCNRCPLALSMRDSLSVPPFLSLYN